jgi:hypothetical protein
MPVYHQNISNKCNFGVSHIILHLTRNLVSKIDLLKRKMFRYRTRTLELGVKEVALDYFCIEVLRSSTVNIFTPLLHIQSSITDAT